MEHCSSTPSQFGICLRYRFVLASSLCSLKPLEQLSQAHGKTVYKLQTVYNYRRPFAFDSKRAQYISLFFFFFATIIANMDGLKSFCLVSRNDDNKMASFSVFI